MEKDRRDLRKTAEIDSTGFDTARERSGIVEGKPQDLHFWCLRHWRCNTSLWENIEIDIFKNSIIEISFIYHSVHSLKMFQWFLSTFTELCKHHHNLTVECFYHPAPQNTIPISSDSLLAPFSRFRATNTVLSFVLPIWAISYQCSHVRSSLLWLASLT